MLVLIIRMMFIYGLIIYCMLLKDRFCELNVLQVAGYLLIRGGGSDQASQAIARPLFSIG